MALVSDQYVYYGYYDTGYAVGDFTPSDQGAVYGIAVYGIDRYGVINTGVDVPGVNTGIILSGNSSSIVKTQTVGRIIRYSPDKEAEIFTLVIRGTMEEAWYSKSTKNNNYITINEENLINLLKGEPFNKQKNISKDNILLRF